MLAINLRPPRRLGVWRGLMLYNAPPPTRPEKAQANVGD